MVRRTTEQALATRHRILDCAELLFQRQGVSRTSLQDIAQAAAVTRGAIYWHFADKADLFNAMLERATMPLEESMAEAGVAGAVDDPGPLRFIEERYIHVLRLLAHHAPTRRVFEILTHKVEYVGELLAVRDRHLHNRAQCLGEFERRLKLAARRGLIERKVSAHELALGLHALVDGLIQNWLLDPAAFDLVRVGGRALRTHLAGMRASATADLTAPT